MPDAAVTSEVRAPRDEGELRAVWDLLCRAFGWSAADYDRFAQGPPPERVRAVWVDGEAVACARIRDFGQFFGGRSVPMGGYSPVAVAPEFRGRGFGSRVCTVHYPLLRERGLVLSGLYPATNALYRRIGFELGGAWGRLELPTRELQRLPLGHGTPTRGATEADRSAIEGCYRRVAQNCPGFLDRSDNFWARIHDPVEQQIYVVDGAGGVIDGYVRYRLQWPSNQHLASLHVAELIADDPAVEQTLWRLVGSSSSVAPTCTLVGPPEHPLLLSLREQDLTISNEWRWMARLIDAPGAIAARGYAPTTNVEVSLRVVDSLCDWNDGRWTLRIESGEGRLDRGGDGEVELGIGAFSTVYTGYASPWRLAAAGLLRTAEPRALAALASAFAGPAPWMPDFY